MMLNQETGETRLDDGLHIIFTVEAFLWAEAQLQQSTMQLVGKAMQLDMGFREAVVLLHCGAEAWRRRNQPNAPKVTPERVQRTIGELGLMQVMPELVESIIASSALGARPDKDDAEEDAVPFGGGPSFDDSSAPVSLPETSIP